MRTWEDWFNQYAVGMISSGNEYVMVREYPAYDPSAMFSCKPSSAKLYNAVDYIIQSIINNSIEDTSEAIKVFGYENTISENKDGSFTTIQFMDRDISTKIYQDPDRKYPIKKVNPYRHCSRPRSDWEKIISEELVKEPF